ncbi:MAG: ATP-binding protein [Bacteroidota bacterium]
MTKSHIQVPCSKLSLAIIREFVLARLKALGVTGKVAQQIVLAADEACANCIIHQHKCDIFSSIELSIYRKSDTVYLEIKDTGKAFPIDTYTPQKLEDIVRKRKKGGLGIMLIKRLMDEVKVEEHPGYFIYRLGKHISMA